jgi:aryl-alcohol dehydrogenase-like predicted oxidoreductase
MHHLATDAPPEETMHALAELRDQGLVRWIGLSNVTLAQLGLFAQAGEIDVVQNRLSVVHDGGHAELVPYCRALGIAFNPYQAIERGLLTGGRDRLFIRRSDDIRRGKPEYSGRPFRLIRAWYEDTVLSIAERHDLPAERLVVGWALSRQCVVCCVLGARTPLQARRNVEAGEPAPPAALAELDQARRALAHEIERTQGVDLATFRGLDSGLLSQEHITTPLHGRRAFS